MSKACHQVEEAREEEVRGDHDGLMMVSISLPEGKAKLAAKKAAEEEVAVS